MRRPNSICLGSVGLGGDASEGCRAAEIQAAVAGLHMVQQVGVIQVPGGQAAHVAITAATGIDSQNARTKFRDDGGWVGEHVDAGQIVGANSVGTGLL